MANGKRPKEKIEKKNNMKSNFLTANFFLKFMLIGFNP